MKKSEHQTLDYDTYLSERRELYKYQQAAYDSYEKTLTALTGSTLALSVAFLAFLQSSRATGASLLVRGTECWLYLTWVSLAIGLICLLICFFVNARAFTVEMRVLDDALKDSTALGRVNNCTRVAIGLYLTSTVLFTTGLLSLLFFCYQNTVR